MGICIIVEKVLEKDGIGYYKAFTKQFNGADFYLGIDKKKCKISYYLTCDFSNPTHVVDCNNPYELIGKVLGVSANILGKVFIRAFKVLQLDNFPNDISLQA